MKKRLFEKKVDGLACQLISGMDCLFRGAFRTWLRFTPGLQTSILSIHNSGCGDGSGDIRLDSLNSIFEVDYYESLPYLEAEKFCLIIGGSLLEKHKKIFPFDLWLPRKQGLCYKYLAYGSGEILADCNERFGLKPIWKSGFINLKLNYQ